MGPFSWNKFTSRANIFNWLSDLPLVYVSFGTSLRNKYAYSLVIKALAKLPVRSIVTTGNQIDSHDLIYPKNVQVVDWIPGRAALANAKAAVIHGGFSTSVACL